MCTLHAALDPPMLHLEVIVRYETATAKDRWGVSASDHTHTTCAAEINASREGSRCWHAGYMRSRPCDHSRMNEGPAITFRSGVGKEEGDEGKGKGRME